MKKLLPPRFIRGLGWLVDEQTWVISDGKAILVVNERHWFWRSFDGVFYPN